MRSGCCIAAAESSTHAALSSYDGLDSAAPTRRSATDLVLHVRPHAQCSGRWCMEGNGINRRPLPRQHEPWRFPAKPCSCVSSSCALQLAGAPVPQTRSGTASFNAKGTQAILSTFSEPAWEYIDWALFRPNPLLLKAKWYQNLANQTPELALNPKP